MDPRQVVSKDIAVLLFNRRQESGTSNRHRTIAEPNVRKPAVDRGKRHARKAKLLRDVFVVVDLEAVGIDPVVANAKLIHQRWPEQMSFTQGQTAVGVVFDAIEKSTAVQNILERWRDKTRLVLVTKAAEGIIFVADPMVNTNIEVVAACTPYGIRQEIVSRDVCVGCREQRRQPGCQRVNRCI